MYFSYPTARSTLAQRKTLNELAKETSYNIPDPATLNRYHAARYITNLKLYKDNKLTKEQVASYMPRT